MAVSHSGCKRCSCVRINTARNTVERPRAPQAANASPEEQARFEAAFDDSTARLRDKKCATALGGYRKAFRALRETIWSFVDFDRGQRGAGNRWEEGAGARTVGRNVDINPYGAFMMNEFGQIGGHKFMGGAFAIRVNVIPVRAPAGGYTFYQVQGSLNMGSFIFLHELGHRTGVFVADSVITSGGAGAGLSLELQGNNNGKIFEACGFSSQSTIYK